MGTQRLPRHPLRHLPGRERIMGYTTLPKHDTKTWTIMLAGLYAQLFRRFPAPATLTRWADLEEELMQL